MDMDQESGTSNNNIKITASEEMCAYCFDVLLCYFQGLEPAEPSFYASLECPLFVTWDKLEHGSRRLRGCIGTLSPRPLSSLKDYTHSSAFRDRRFQPIAEHEIPSLQVAVSLLVEYEQAQSYDDWEVGMHGILINFMDSNNRHFSATYLPEVAPEQGWDQLETVQSLIRKAGFQGKITNSLLKNMEVTRYQSSKFKLCYSEYCAMRGITC